MITSTDKATHVSIDNLRIGSGEGAPAPQGLASGLCPCQPCGGYHYVPECIYTIPWSDWLAYQSEHMPSQLDQLAGASNISPHQLDSESLQERVSWLDRLSSTYRPNYVGKSRMKADIMTPSAIDSYWYETIWQSKLRAGSRYRARKEWLQRPVAVDSGQTYGNLDGYESEDDATKIEHLKAIFGRNLPQTSTATLFKRDRLMTVEHDEEGGWELVDSPVKMSLAERRDMASAS